MPRDSETLALTALSVDEHDQIIGSVTAGEPRRPSLYDMSESYRLAFLILAVASALAVPFTLFLKPPPLDAEESKY